MENNPALMARQLSENARRIAELSDIVCNARNALLLAEADYMDAQAESYLEHSQNMGVTAAEKLSKIDTIKQWKDREEAKVFLQNCQDRLRVLETDNNNLKVRIKLTDLEVKNLNL